MLQAWPCAVLSEEECALLAPFPHDLEQIVPWNVVCKFQRWLPAQGRRRHPATFLNTRPRTPRVKPGASGSWFWRSSLRFSGSIGLGCGEGGAS